MTVALHHGLLHLKKYKVPRMIAIADKDNHNSIRILERLGFRLIDEEITGKRAILNKAL